MTQLLENGDYVMNSENDNFVMIDYIDELLQTAKINLTVRRGSFYPNKNFGSSIHLAVDKSPIEEYISAFARQALDCLDGVLVKSVELVDIDGSTDKNAIIHLIINDEERQVSIKLEDNV